MMNEISTPSSKTYEQVTQYLLRKFREHFGLDAVEGEQTLSGERGGDWSVDLKGIRADNFVIGECKERSRRIERKDLTHLVYEIGDTGAAGGIFVTTLGFQKGARKVAKAAGIQCVTLYRGSTITNYILRFLNKTFCGMSAKLNMTGRFEARLISGACNCGEHKEHCANGQCS